MKMQEFGSLPNSLFATKSSASFQWKDFPLSIPRLVSQISQGHRKRNATLILCRWNNQ
ncbi:MAG TPA: hypothetical protein VGD14_03815 [bacterium]